jgi:drug/metabolite transporter (DMT)-like permease
VTVVLGLLAAVLYGVGDFLGGFTARRASSVTVLLYSYPVGAVLMTLLLPAFPGAVTPRVVLFGVLGGAAGLVGVVILYHLMTVAPMNIVSPVTAVLAAFVPVFVGVVVGERPRVLAWIGVVAGLLAVVLVSRTDDDHPAGRIPTRVLLLAVLSGLGFGLYFVFLARAGNDSGLWPLVISRVASAVLIVPLAAQRPGGISLVRGNTLALVAAAGACDAGANMAFLLAARHGLLTLAGVLTSLYPAVTVLLAAMLLREHTSGPQRAGLALAAASVVLITV